MTRFSSNRLVLLICVLAFAATAAVAVLAFERLPHLEDEVAYLYQAKTMALGRLKVPSPEPPGAFWTPFVLDYQGQRFGKYPPGWPALLSLGVLAGAPWVINPLLAALCAYLLFRLGKTLYDDRAGLLAAALSLASPLFLVLSGSFLSHMASLVWLLLFCLWFVWTAQGRSRWYAVGAGLALGMAFLTRPLTAAACATPFIVYSLIQVLQRRQPTWTSYLIIALSGGAMATLLPLYQWYLTGDPWLNPYLLWWPYDRIGFGPGHGAMPGGHSPYYAWINLRQDIPRAATDLLGWPATSWIALLLGLGLKPRRGRDWALLAPAGCLVAAYVFYWIGSPSRLWGPRYYFESFAGLWLLSAVGLLKVWDWARTRRTVWLRPVLLGAIVVISVAQVALNIPGRMQEAHGFYGITRSQLDPIIEAELEEALVIVYAERWLEYGALMAQMNPLLDDTVIYARGSNSEGDAAVIAEFPERTVYYLSQNRLTTTPPKP